MSEPIIAPRELHGKRLLGYIIGGFGFSLTNMLSGVFVFQYYVYTINLNSLLVSIGLAIQLIIAALCSILWGVIIDNKKPGKFGKRRPYLFYGLPIWVVTSILLWLPPWYCPKNNSMFWPTAIYFWIIIIINPIAGTSVIMAHASMFPEQSQTEENRQKIASSGTILLIIASILGLLVPLVVQSLLPDPENIKWWDSSGKIVLFYIPLIGTTFAIFALFCVVITFFSVDESFHKATLEAEVEKVSISMIFHQMIIPAKDKKFRKFMAVGLFNGVSGRLVGLIIIPFLIFVLKFRGTDYFIYVFVSFTCKFGWYYFWKKISERQALIKAFSLCIAFSVITSFLELFFLIEILSFEFKIALFIISYGTVLGSMYAFGLFNGPVYSALVYEAAAKIEPETENLDEAVSSISGAYTGLLTFMASVGPAIASLLLGFILMGSNQENSEILTICLASTGIFYLIALLYLRQIKLDKSISEIKTISIESKEILPPPE
ncbi:MAG: hypothetical protein EU529_10135 [Promethearchaeota archaeon]|nr:MAG: hypothetical protein EU529_10135 [Candidatus Lokiarchaeota archaeon]